MLVNQTRPMVLIVDDQQDLLQMVAFGLANEGFDVVTAPSGNEAISAVKQHKFDVALLDLMMPGMDGVQTLTELKAIDPEVQVVVGTGYASAATASACIRQGAYDYIEKPYHLHDLSMLLERACGHGRRYGRV